LRESSDELTVQHPVAPGEINYPLVKAHGKLYTSGQSIIVCAISGAIMMLAWGLFAPVGIILVIFYKVVWPNGEWFYVSVCLF